MKIHHIGYFVDDIASAISTFETLGYCSMGDVLFNPPSPAPAIEGCPNVAFLKHRHIGITKLVERVKTNENS